MGVKTTAECQSFGGSCGTNEDCVLTTHVLTGSCDDAAYDGCCFSKVTVCDAKKGSFITEEECAAKSNYMETGLHLDSNTCCAPAEGNGTGSGNGNGNGDGSAGMSFVQVSHGLHLPVTLFCIYCVLCVVIPHLVEG